MARFRSHVGRAIDLSFPSNRQALNIAAMAGVAGAVFGWWGERDWRVAGVTALVWAGTSFLAWATGRELHHDQTRPAVFAAVLAPVGAAIFGAPSFTIVGALILAGRVSLGSTGRRLLATDMLGLSALGLWISRSSAGWAVAIVLAVAIARVGTMGVPHAKLFGLGLAMGATTVLVLSGGFSMGALDSAAPIAVALGSVIGMGIAPRAVCTAPTDRGGPPPSPSDQFVARLLVLVGVLAATLISADAGIVATAAAGLISLSIRAE